MLFVSARAIIVAMERASGDQEDTHDDLPLRVAAARSLRRVSHALVGHRAEPEILEALAQRESRHKKRNKTNASSTKDDGDRHEDLA